MEEKIIIKEVKGITNLDEVAERSLYGYENGYISGLIKYESNDESYSVISYALNEEKKEVVPTRMIITPISSKDIVPLFKTIILSNNKAIYATNIDEFYLIDLLSTTFDEKCVPKNYITKFSGYYFINDFKMLVMINKKWYIYNIKLNKIESYTFDNLRINKETNEIYGIFTIRIDLEEHYVVCIIDSNGNIKNDVSFDGFEFVVPSNVLVDVSLLKKYLVDSYIYLMENPPRIGGMIC